MEAQVSYPESPPKQAPPRAPTLDELRTDRGCLLSLAQAFQRAILHDGRRARRLPPGPVRDEILRTVQVWQQQLARTLAEIDQTTAAIDDQEMRLHWWRNAPEVCP